MQVWPVSTDADDDIVTDRDRVDPAGIDLAEVVRYELLQPANLTDAAGIAVCTAEVEAAQPVNPAACTFGYLIEIRLDFRRELVVDQSGEVLFHQSDDRECGERRHQRGTLFPDISTILDRLDNRGVRRGSTDAELLERLHKGRLGVTGRRRGGVALGIELLAGDLLPSLNPWHAAFFVVAAALLVVLAFDVRAQEARECNRGAARAELGLLTARGLADQADRHGLADGVRHL